MGFFKKFGKKETPPPQTEAEEKINEGGNEGFTPLEEAVERMKEAIERGEDPFSAI